jgi:NAD+ synthase
MDLCLYGLDHGTPAEQVASVVGLAAEQVERIYRMIASKRKAAQYLHMPPLMIDPPAFSRPDGK